MRAGIAAGRIDMTPDEARELFDDMLNSDEETPEGRLISVEEMELRRSLGVA